MYRFRFASVTIASAGYDALREVLEVEFTRDGQIVRYYEVPEDIWYRFRRESSPDKFFHSSIKGYFAEKRIKSR